MNDVHCKLLMPYMGCVSDGESYVTQSEKRALLMNFIVLQETGKHENSDHCMKIFLFQFIDLHGTSYHLIYYNLLSKVHSFLSYGMFYKTKTVHDSL